MVRRTPTKPAATRRSHTNRGTRPGPMENADADGVSRQITRVTLKGLFGQYDYDLPNAPGIEALRDVVILYGDNGCGKTTLLKLIFHLLSPANNRSHRTSLYQIPFHAL